MGKVPGRMRHVYVAAGTVCLGLGILGIVLPLLPTTPLLLLAAACYARGSERFYHWLLNHRWFGPHIRNYRDGAGIPLRAKVTAVTLVWATILLAVVFAVELPWVRVLLIAIAAGISAYLLRLPTLRRKDTPPVQGSDF
jgi:uncharacterized membrane protein YbaN (DUF454 family)